MHFSSAALVLSTLVIGQVAAVPSNKHASFHARRQQNQPEQRDVPGKDDPFWKTAVDWDAVFKTVAATQQTPAAKPAVAEAKAKVTSAAAVSYAAPSSTAPAAAATSKASSNAGNVVNGAIKEATDTLSGVTTWLKKLGSNLPDTANPTSNNGKCWLGNDGTNKITFSNTASEDALIVCWETGKMWINANPLSIAQKLSAGTKQTISFGANWSGACAPAYPSTTTENGAIKNTLLEFTFAEGAGGFNVGREVNMKGTSITAVGNASGCTSSMDQCVFMCKDFSAPSCQYDYDLYHRTDKCGGGPVAALNGATGGSCELHGKAEHLDVTIDTSTPVAA